jgi:ATP-dependent Clp protease ATP-binding subunit ClpA
MVLAEEQARMHSHDWIGTEHILLGLIQEGDGVAVKALESLGISLEAVRQPGDGIIGEQRLAEGREAIAGGAVDALEAAGVSGTLIRQGRRR